MTLYNPHVNGPGAASIYLERGIERIQAGWIVDNGRITGCYNSICPGYVHTNGEVPIDYAFPKVSFPMFDNYEVGIRIYLDEDYWLQLWFETDVGFWPFNIFKELKNAANIAGYGGEVFTPAGEMVSPQMGNGQFLAGLQRSTCHMRQVVYEGDVQEFPPDPSIVTTHQSRCYYEGSENNALDDYWVYNFIFGGEGNCTVPPI
ncbi:protein neprosin-like [Lycium barbarum]|uniref:protein neprosin-like n=1 Tax=Lycium barbarum TaxID=112863 RepID=UPI00293E586F|nr:protein neprosin-like [Lycium barbarum]XP_060200625.1 protein neprosin-like [Lycium barbarum]